MIGAQRNASNRWVTAVLLVATAAIALTPGSTAADRTSSVEPPEPFEVAGSIVMAEDIHLPIDRPLGPVTVIGDSVLLGSGLYSPTLPDRLVEHGWGPVRYRGAVGMTAGVGTTSNDAAWWIRHWRAQGWDARDVIVNLGANDSGICGINQACARTRILAVLDEIGFGHRIWWPKITRTQTSPDLQQQQAWNAALDQLAAARPDLYTWDWPAELASGGYGPASDYVHLSPAGYRKRSETIAQAFTHDMTRSVRVGGDAPLPVPAAGPSTYVPLVPERVIDTRSQDPGRRPAGSVLTVDFGALIPAGASAVAVNVTATGAAAAGFLAAGGCGAPIAGSTVNFERDVDRGAMAITPLGTGDDLCVFSSADTDVVVDLQGVFVGDGGVGLHPLAVQDRLADTRATGRQGRLVLDTPPGASAVAVNLTVVGAASAGWLRAFPCDATTEVSNVNYGAGEAVAGSAFVRTSADDTICVETSVSADVIVDLTGTFGAGGLSFVPVAPTRMLDTRSAIGGWAPIHGNGQTLDAGVVPPGAAAVTGTLTMVEPLGGGFLTGHACGELPPTSSVNAAPGEVLANALTAAVSGSGRLCLYAWPTTHTLFDVTGWWTS